MTRRLRPVILTSLLALIVAGCTLIDDVPFNQERGRGRDDVTTDKKRAAIEQLYYRSEWEIAKYADDEAFRRKQPFEVARIYGNLLLNEGINAAWNLVAAAGGTAFNNANARCGVGDSSAAEAATQTDLQAATNKLYKAQNATFPTSGSSQQIVFKCDFTSAEANFAWNEFTVDNGAAAGLNLNRKISTQGTKASGQTWTLTLTITLS